MEKPTIKFFENSAFVCVDLQDGKKGGPTTDDKLPGPWKKAGFTAEDVNAANDFAWDVCIPNAIKVVEACRKVGMPMIFIHWGHQFADGMDLDPIIRTMILRVHGAKDGFPGHMSDSGSKPYSGFHVRDGEYVLAKTAQDAFISSNIHFVLANLGAHNLVFVGGNTEACLGKTATSAKQRGYHTLCIEDATNNARESTRMKGIEDAQFDHVVTTENFLALVEEHLKA